jgi:NodT family efflux transporter outer membrane factor (OMF) lipoprotein
VGSNQAKCDPAREEAQATAADLETARLSLQAELAFNYFELRSADAQQRLLNDTVKAFEEALQLTTRRYEGGAAPKSDVAQARTQLETTQVQATDIGVQRAQFEHAIAILIGKPPADFSLPAIPLDLQPPDIPAGLPSELLERRPDIAAAERRVAEANEQIGIAKAAYFPTVTLNALFGFESSSINKWMGWQSFLWAVGSSLAQTIFDGGRRRATSEAALANYDATVATYRQTTLDAFQQVEDNLAALRILEREPSSNNARWHRRGNPSSSSRIVTKVASTHTSKLSPLRPPLWLMNETRSISCAVAWTPACCWSKRWVADGTLRICRNSNPAPHMTLPQCWNLDTVRYFDTNLAADSATRASTFRS